MAKSFRKSLSLLTAVLMLMCILPIGANAQTMQEDVQIWDGSIAAAFGGGTGTEEDPYIIADGSQLAYLAQQVNNGNNYKGEYFKMADDIYLNDTDGWENWGTVNGKPFIDSFKASADESTNSFADLINAEFKEMQSQLEDEDLSVFSNSKDAVSETALSYDAGSSGNLDSLSKALNAPGSNIVFTTCSDYPWTVDSTSFDGRTVGRSGNAYVRPTGIPPITVSKINAGIQLEAGGKISFDYNVSTKPRDFMLFLVNGQPKLTVLQSQDWTTYTFTADEAGVYNLEWGFCTGSASPIDHSVADCCWIDNVRAGNDVPATGVEAAESLEVSVNNEMQLEYNVLPEGTYNNGVRFEAADTEIASVDDFGLVTGLSEGNTVITVTTVDGGFTCTCNVTVYNQPAEGVTVNPTEAQIYINHSMQLNAVLTPENVSNRNVAWTVDNPDVLSVDENGVVTGISEGTAVVTVTTQDGGFTADARIDVSPVPVEGVAVSPASALISLGRNAKFEAEISPDDAANKNVHWSVSDDEIISVDQEGNVAAIGEGTAKVTVKTEDGNFEASAEVTVCNAPKNDWIAIGLSNKLSFRGNFNGDGHTVYGLYMNESANDHIGLFGTCWESEISNLGVEKGYVCGAENVGGISGFIGRMPDDTSTPSLTNCHSGNTIVSVGKNNKASGGLLGSGQWILISDCCNTGNVTTAFDDAGGIAGLVLGDNSEITNCSNSGDIISSDDHAGGIVGFLQNKGVILSNSRNTGLVSGTESIGGICGYNQSAEIINCNNHGNITGITSVGGIAGVLSGMFAEPWVKNSCNTGNVIAAKESAGGLVGTLQPAAGTHPAFITDCYNTGNVTAPKNVGGAVGDMFGTVTNCYNIGEVKGDNAETTGAFGGRFSGAGIPSGIAVNCYYLDICCINGDKNAKPLTGKQFCAAENYVGFDFETVWTMEGSPLYPYAELAENNHVGENLPGDYDCDGEVDTEDVILTLRAAMELIPSSGQALINADMDGDGKLTAADALTILRITMDLL